MTTFFTPNRTDYFTVEQIEIDFTHLLNKLKEERKAAENEKKRA